MTPLERALLALSRKSKYKTLMERLAAAFASGPVVSIPDQQQFWHHIPEIVQLSAEGYTAQQIFAGMKEVLMGIRIQEQESV